MYAEVLALSALQVATHVFTAVAWFMLVMFLLSGAFWLFEIIVIGRAPHRPIEYGPEEVEVRVLTIDDEDVVQATVDSLPDDLSAIRVVAETEIDIDGADVCVVPDEFSCEATRKGRAIEWARREVASDAEYILYIDEDTLLRDFNGVPDADIVQLAERPIRSGSWISYLADVYRMGFQIEQATFPRLRYPLYAWGGGLAVRKSLEDEITWDSATVTEDTNFIWRAFVNADVELAFLRVKAFNQAPPSVRELIHQRRRWVSGAMRDVHFLPLHYRLLSYGRSAAWGLVTAIPLLGLPLVTPLQVSVMPDLYGLVVGVNTFGLFGWAAIGYWYQGERVSVLAALLLTVPVVAVVHSSGALWGLLSPVKTFRVTKKVSPGAVDKEVEEEFDVDPETVQEADDEKVEEVESATVLER